MSKARDIADLDFNAPDIDGGNIDGAVIGGTTPAAGSFTSGIFTGTAMMDRLGLGVAAHASAALNITTTDQHIRFNNGSELGIIDLNSDGELNIWAHGDGEVINLKTGSGTGTNVLSVVGTDVGIGTSSSTPQDHLEVRAADSIGGITISHTAHNQAALSFARNSTATARIFTTEPSSLHTSALNFQTSDASGGAPNLVTRLTLGHEGSVLVGGATNLDVLSGTPKIQVGAGTGHSSIQFWSGASNVSALYFGKATTGAGRYDGYIEYRHHDQTMAFRADADTRMSLSDSGLAFSNGGVLSSSNTQFIGYEDSINIINADPVDGGSDFDFTPINNSDGGGTTWAISGNGDSIYLSNFSGGHAGTFMKVYVEAGMWAIKGSVRLTNTDGTVHGGTPSANYKYTASFRFWMDSGPDTGNLRWDADGAAAATGTPFTRAAFSTTAVSQTAGYKNIYFQTNGYEGVQQIYITNLELVKVG